MTGGPDVSEGINRAIAEAAQEMGFAMGVGSQRIALTTGESHGLDQSSGNSRPTCRSMAISARCSSCMAWAWTRPRRAVEQIEADALILHLNPLQEALQEGGDRNWRGVEAAIAQLARNFPLPIIVKEVGSGISAEVAQRLADCGVAAIDVAGAGGTSWAAVEGRSAGDAAGQALGEIFRDWGIPTTDCLIEIHRACPDLPLVASGGIRNGLDGAKAIRLGATLVGQAAALLPAAMRGTEAVIVHVTEWATALRIACFATGSRNLGELRSAALI